MICHKYKIILQIFNDAQTLFRLSKIGESGFIDKTAQEISSDIDIIQSLSNEDAYLIGYVSATEKILLDFSILNIRRSYATKTI